MRIARQKCGSAHCGPIAEGCEHCMNGSKMVLFITGKCETGCFYCPISFEKKGKDLIYANEMKVENENDIIAEAESMEATGTGITGGDPLLKIERTIKVIKMLKKHFGKEHHIHLYTSTIDYDLCNKLQDAGLDEIRFHPPVEKWTSMDSTELEKISKLKMDVGLEVPALPDYENELQSLIKYTEKINLKFVNLNELEFSESNYDMMKKHDYGIKDETSAAVLGSREVAFNVMKSSKIPIHFCSSTFKDGVQLRNRLIRKAKHIAKEYEIVTEDGTILRGLIYADDLNDVVKLMKNEYDVPDILMSVDSEKKRIEIAPWIVEELAKELPFKCYISETYPTADCLEVERIPLN